VIVLLMVGMYYHRCGVDRGKELIPCLLFIEYRKAIPVAFVIAFLIVKIPLALQTFD